MHDVIRAMPQYQCHKKVWALKIKEIVHNRNPDETGKSGASSYGAQLIVEDYFDPISVSAEYMCKHNPQTGGYYVVCDDGYKSFIPADVFESGYTKLN